MATSRDIKCYDIKPDSAVRAVSKRTISVLYVITISLFDDVSSIGVVPARIPTEATHKGLLMES